MAAPTDYDDCMKSVITRGHCSVHGGRMVDQQGTCQTVTVLADVRAERARQYARHGSNSTLSDGTGPEVPWMGNVADFYQSRLAAVRRFPGAGEIETHLRNDYEAHEARTGKPTWMHLVREEVAEVFAENDPQRLRAELIQVAALAVSWVEKLDARQTPSGIRPGSRKFAGERA